MGTKVTNFRNILSIMTLKKLKIFSFVAFAELHKDIRTDVQMGPHPSPLLKEREPRRGRGVLKYTALS